VVVVTGDSSGKDGVDHPDIALAAAEMVSTSEVNRGILNNVKGRD
jgi:hypothetical protein